MKVLELFAGSRSIGNVAESLGHQVFSVDIHNFDGIDLVIDILNLKKEMIPFKPDLIWASPPCTYFSVASIGKHWNKNHTPKSKEAYLGLKIMNKTLDVFNWFPNAHFYMENPRGKMRKKIKRLPRTTIWYCRYGDIRAKPTDIWSNNIYNPLFNKNGWKPRAECWNNNKNCQHEAAPRGARTGTQGLKDNYERSKVPIELCYEILNTLNCEV